MAKRPDTTLRNKLNNPMSDPSAREKMRASLTGKTQSEETKAKRSAKLKAYYAAHPDAKKQRARNLHEKYTSNIPPGWRKMRLKALARDNFTCQGCGETSRRLLVVHHLDYQGRNLGSHTKMNNDLDNLITWCYRCHNAFHRHKAKDYQERMAAIGKRAA